MTTELDDLKSAWESLNQKLERQQGFILDQFRERKADRLRTGFRPLIAGNIIQIGSGLLFTLWGGSFWFDRLGLTHLMGYGLALHLYGIMMIVFGLRDLVLIKQLDYAAPVLTLQKQIATLRDRRVRAGLWFGVASCFIWVPVLLMIFYWLGVDVWRREPAVVGWFLVSAVICAAITLAIASWSRRSSREAISQNLPTHVAGRSVARAQAILDEIRQFEDES